MRDNGEFLELSDDELDLVVGGHHKHPSQGNPQQQNNVVSYQYADAQGLVAVAFNVNVVTPVNVAVNVKL